MFAWDPYATLKCPEQFQIIRSYTFIQHQVPFVFKKDRSWVRNISKDEIAEQILTDFKNKGTDCQTYLQS